MSQLGRRAGALLVVLLLSACGTDRGPAGSSAAEVQGQDDGYAGTLVADPPLRPADVTLQDSTGRPHALARIGREKVTAIFFGFTHCGDVCPTTMADLAAARRSLPPDLAQEVEVFFVTVDPLRDTASALRRWLDRFDPSFVGLRGPVRTVHRLEDSLYAAPSSAGGKVPPSGGHAHSDRPDERPEAEYQVSHTGSVYLFAPDDISVVHTGGTTVSQYATDFTRLLRRP